jgi:hypothetical protein
MMLANRPTLLNLRNNRLAAEILFQCVKFNYERGEPITLKELVEECIKSGYKKQGSVKTTAAKLKRQRYFEEDTNYYRPLAVVSNPRTAKLAMEIDEAGDQKVDEIQFLQQAGKEYAWRDGDTPNKHLEFLINQGYCEKREGGLVQTTRDSRFGMELNLIERVAKLDSGGNFGVEWKDLMPQAAKLLERENPASPNIKNLLRHVDATLVGAGVFRSDWWIEIRYDRGRLSSNGMIRENLRWTYTLTNTSGSPTKHNLTLMSAPHLQKHTGVPSFYELVGSSAQDLLSGAASKTGVFANRGSEIELGPLKSRTLVMSYSQDWAVSPQYPTIHNCFSPKETAFGRTLLTIDAPYAEKVGVLFKNSELSPAVSSPDTYVFTIDEPILQGQVLEVLVTFQPASLTTVGKVDKNKGKHTPVRHRTTK